MALIKCPECGKEISNKATSCPHCGYPINNDENIASEHHSPIEENSFIIHPLVDDETKKQKLSLVKQYLKKNPPKSIRTKTDIVDIKPKVEEIKNVSALPIVILLLCTITLIGVAIFLVIAGLDFSACIPELLLAVVFGFLTYSLYNNNKKNITERKKQEAALREYEQNTRERERNKKYILDSYYRKIDAHNDIIKLPCVCHGEYHIISKYGNIVYGYCEKCFRGSFIGLCNSDGTIYSSQRILMLFNGKDLEAIYTAVETESMNIRMEMNAQDAEDYIALSVLSGIIQNQNMFGWAWINQFACLTLYKNMSLDAQNTYAEMLYNTVDTEELHSDGSHGSGAFISYYYPIYCVITQSTSNNSRRLKSILQNNHFGETMSEYDYVLQMYAEHKSKTHTMIEAIEANKPKCPMCGSTRIKRISTLNRAVSIELVGLASQKIGKQYQCESCKHLW